MKKVWIALLVMFCFVQVSAVKAQSQPIATDRDSVVSRTIPNERRVVVEPTEEPPMIVRQPSAQTQYETQPNLIAYNVREISPVEEVLRWTWQGLFGLVLVALGAGILIGGRQKRTPPKEKHPDYL